MKCLNFPYGSEVFQVTETSSGELFRSIVHIGEPLKAINGFFKELILLSAISLLTFTLGCSYQYVDEEGNKHIVGLVKIVIPNSHHDDCKRNAVSVTSVGLAATQLPSHSGLSIGYSRNETVAIPLYPNDCIAEIYRTFDKEAEEGK